MKHFNNSNYILDDVVKNVIGIFSIEANLEKADLNIPAEIVSMYFN